MNKAASIRASPGPAPPVFPPAPRPLGLLVLDTRFPRPPGDLGRADSWPVPVLRQVVLQAWPSRVVQPAGDRVAQDLLGAFVEAARSLQAHGAAAITTSCGFLVLLQRQLQAAVQVPLVSSSLLLLPDLLAAQAQVGVLTIRADALGREHLLCAGVTPDRLDNVVVQGVDPAGAFARAILGNKEVLDVARAEHEVVEAAVALQRRCPQLRDVVLECTNMPPYRSAIVRATGLQVRSLIDSPVLRLALAGRTG